MARRHLSDSATIRANRGWWDANADDYQAEHGAFLGDDRFIWCPEGLDEADARLLGADLAGKRVLEVGAGAAQCSRWLAAQGAYAVASDLSFGQLAHALRIDAGTALAAAGIGVAGAASAGADSARAEAAGVAGAAGGEADLGAGTEADAGAGAEAAAGAAGAGADAVVGVPLVQADATRLPFADEAFDIVCAAYGAVPFVADSAAVMREAARVLKPGGRWVFSVSHPIRWSFPDDPTEAGLTARDSYFDRRPYVEFDDRGLATYAEHHRTMGDRVREIAAAGLRLVDVVEPEWPAGLTEVWGGWSPLRGRIIPGTAVFVTVKE
ncbi:class I SAM-dependent methyltransferase [Catenulispora sp. EB89]|uniref:class I SAM-dependent methyltransferase n=1 Tax=Catenulispora sp. EB89 TaxID=3156257 RepID=UPI0035164E06